MLRMQGAAQQVTAMSQPQPGGRWIYQCDDIVVEPRAHRFERAGVELSVEPKAYAVLVALLQQAGEVVGKDALLDAAWGHRHVTPGVLTRAISQLRHALGDCPDHPRYIATVHSLGYRFIGDVRRMPAAMPGTAPAAAANDGDAYVPPAKGGRPAPLPWLAAAITLAVIVAVLAAMSLWQPPRNRLTSPRLSPRPALVLLPFAHAYGPHPAHPRHRPHTRRLATVHPASHAPLGAAGYLALRPEQAPVAQR
jgi:DNA-binding winged helix-turn-helix (wHTH) protein